jgi:2-polyprenyl-3-methyl-5-hydroxy-6-metoxy-1,4-benzoquinol methylase
MILDRFIAHLWLKWSGWPKAADRLARLAIRYRKHVSSDEYMRFLLALDEKVYSLEGPAAVAAEGGVHPKHRLTDYHGFFISRISATESALDIGCGHGLLSEDIARQAGARVTGIELSQANVAKARAEHAHPDVTYIHGDACRDLPDSHFDVVILSNVLEPIEDRVELLRQVQAGARPSRWLLRVPLFERDWRVPLKKELGLEWRLDVTHHTEYTLESFREEMEQAGLDIAHLEVRWGEIWAECVPQENQQ